MDSVILRKVQLTQLEIMKYIDGVCRRNNIPYYLCAGSMLGAVRHNGFIPWDDDLDIMLLRGDYERLLDLLEKEETDMYWLQSYKTDADYWNPYAKLRKVGTVYKEKGMENLDDVKCGVWVDIFPLDYADSENSLMLRARKALVKTIGFSLRKRTFGMKIRAFSRRYIPALLLWQCFPIKMLKKLQEKLMRGSGKQKEHIANIASTYAIQKETYPYKWFQQTQAIAFEDTEFFVPNGYDMYLTKLYKNYMELPPVEKRQGHNISNESHIVV